MQEGPLWAADCEKEIVGTAAAMNRESGLYIPGRAALPGARSQGLGSFGFHATTESRTTSGTPLFTRGEDIGVTNSTVSCRTDRKCGSYRD
jgi:hypothetical protein